MVVAPVLVESVSLLILGDPGTDGIGVIIHDIPVLLGLLLLWLKLRLKLSSALIVLVLGVAIGLMATLGHLVSTKELILRVYAAVVLVVTVTVVIAAYKVIILTVDDLAGGHTHAFDVHPIIVG